MHRHEIEHSLLLLVKYGPSLHVPGLTLLLQHLTTYARVNLLPHCDSEGRMVSAAYDQVMFASHATSVRKQKSSHSLLFCILSRCASDSSVTQLRATFINLPCSQDSQFGFCSATSELAQQR